LRWQSAIMNAEARAAAWREDFEVSSPALRAMAATRARKFLILGGLIMGGLFVAFVAMVVIGLSLSGNPYHRNAPAVVAGKVEVTYDPEIKAAADQLAKEGGAGLAVAARVVGREVPNGQVYRLHLFTRGEDFNAAVKDFERDSNGTSLTIQSRHESYLYLWLRHGPADVADLAMPLYLRGESLHELCHLLYDDLFSRAARWPRWLSEGLSELGAYEVLASRSPEEARHFDAYRRGRWREAAHRKKVPANGRELLRFAKEDLGTQGLYSSAFFLLRHLKQTGSLIPLLTRIEAGQAPERVLADLIGDIDEVWQQLTREVMAGAPLPGIVRGTMDEVDGGYRLLSQPGWATLAWFDGQLHRAPLTINATIAIRPVGEQRAYLYLQHVGEEPEVRFLRIAIAGDVIELERGSPGLVEVLASVRLEKPLKPSGSSLAWYRAKIVWNNSLKVFVDGHAAARFEVAPLTTEPTRVMVGGGDGVVYFKNVAIASAPVTAQSR
jgi:hypothetical protein